MGHGKEYGKARAETGTQCMSGGVGGLGYQLQYIQKYFMTLTSNQGSSARTTWAAGLGPKAPATVTASHSSSH
jgi:hypothetical protein